MFALACVVVWRSYLSIELELNSLSGSPCSEPNSAETDFASLLIVKMLMCPHTPHESVPWGEPDACTQEARSRALSGHTFFSFALVVDFV